LNPSLEINQYAHKAWTIRDGFFKAVIHSIAQTPDSYLWLGTESGLLRFDGVRYISWQPPAGESLPSSLIQSLLAARDGRLWIGTDKGLVSWKNGKLNSYMELAGDRVSALLEDQNGTVWAGTNEPNAGRLCALQNVSVQCYGQDGSLGHAVYSLHEENGRLWASTTTGVWQWKPGPPKLYPVPSRGRDFQRDLSDDNGQLLVSVQGEIRQLVDGQFVEYRTPPAGAKLKAARLLRDRDGSLWMGTSDRGLFHLHQGKTDRFTRSDGLSDDAIYTLFQDRESNIWAVTADGFRDFAVATVSAKQGLSADDVWSVQAGSDGSVWLGTREGLNRWNNGRITAYGKENGLPGDPECLFQDDRGRIWAATSQGIAYFEGGRFVRVPSLPKGQTHSVAEDNDGNMWFAYDDSLVELLKGGSVRQTAWPQLGHQEGAVAQIPDPGRGGLWLGFRLEGGVAYLKDGQIRASYTAANGLGKGVVGDLQVDRDGTLWAATEGG
jgi:ligand-binding sensor domain-containing protein